MVVLGGEFRLLLFIGVMAAGCWSELRGWLLFGGVVKIGLTVHNSDNIEYFIYSRGYVMSKSPTRRPLKKVEVVKSVSRNPGINTCIPIIH